LIIIERILDKDYILLFSPFFIGSDFFFLLCYSLIHHYNFFYSAYVITLAFIRAASLASVKPELKLEDSTAPLI